MKWYIARRLAWTVFAAYLLLTAAFFAFALTPDPNEQLIGFAAANQAVSQNENPTNASRQAMAAYREARNRDRPLLTRYRDWVVGYATLQWGYSYAYGQSVTSVLATTIPRTLAYLVPGILISTALSIATGVYSALNRNGIVDLIGRAFGYVGLGVPVFALALLFTVEFPTVIDTLSGVPGLGEQRVRRIVLPAALIGFNLYAIQVWAVRNEALEIVPAEFVKTLRANGATQLRIARHILKNATAPILALFVSEVVVTLLITVIVVEWIISFDGIGFALFRAFQDRDIGLILGSLLVLVLTGLLGNLLQDLVAGYVDPRVAEQQDR